jgi:hypothetical protein
MELYDLSLKVFQVIFEQTLKFVFVALLVPVLFIALGNNKALAQSPTVNGLFYGDGDDARYIFLASDPGRGYLYYYIEGSTYYFAVVLDPSVNDNVFGDVGLSADQTYVQSAGWEGQGNKHNAKALINSDHLEFTIQCDSYSWTWKQDYADDADEDRDPAENDWYSDEMGTDGSGSDTAPPGYNSSSSFVANMNHAAQNPGTAWDVTLGGSRTKTDEWKSVDGDNDNDVTDEGYSTYNSTYNWEWALVYEFSVDLSQCSSDPTVKVNSAHNSPSKDGNENVIIPPDGDITIAVELSSFSVACVDGAVQLQWTTQTETENMGYHVYRSKNEDGQYTKITKELILGAGNSDEAHSYAYTDRDVEYGNTYYYKLADIDFNANSTFHGPISVSVEAMTPSKYVLEQSYPNPFNPETAINFSIKQTGKVSLKIYNVQGQLIRSLVDANKLAGSYSIIWNGTDDQGTRVSSGTYLYTLKVNGFEDTKKLVFMK